MEFVEKQTAFEIIKKRITTDRLNPFSIVFFYFRFGIEKKIIVTSQFEDIGVLDSAIREAVLMEIENERYLITDNFSGDMKDVLALKIKKSALHEFAKDLKNSEMIFVYLKEGWEDLEREAIEILWQINSYPNTWIESWRKWKDFQGWSHLNRFQYIAFDEKERVKITNIGREQLEKS